MPFSSKDLFGDTSDLDGFSDDEDNGNLGKSKKYRDFTRTGNLFPNKKIRAGKLSLIRFLFKDPHRFQAFFCLLR